MHHIHIPPSLLPPFPLSPLPISQRLYSPTRQAIHHHWHPLFLPTPRTTLIIRLPPRKQHLGRLTMRTFFRCACCCGPPSFSSYSCWCSFFSLLKNDIGKNMRGAIPQHLFLFHFPHGALLFLCPKILYGHGDEGGGEEGSRQDLHADGVGAAYYCSCVCVCVSMCVRVCVNIYERVK